MAILTKPYLCARCGYMNTGQICTHCYFVNAPPPVSMLAELLSGSKPQAERIVKGTSRIEAIKAELEVMSEDERNKRFDELYDEMGTIAHDIELASGHLQEALMVALSKEILTKETPND